MKVTTTKLVQIRINYKTAKERFAINRFHAEKDLAPALITHQSKSMFVALYEPGDARKLTAYIKNRPYIKKNTTKSKVEIEKFDLPHYEFHEPNDIETLLDNIEHVKRENATN